MNVKIATQHAHAKSLLDGLVGELYNIVALTDCVSALLKFSS